MEQIGFENLDRPTFLDHLCAFEKDIRGGLVHERIGFVLGQAAQTIGFRHGWFLSSANSQRNQRRTSVPDVQRLLATLHHLAQRNFDFEM